MPAVGDYVELQDLEVGTVLRTYGAGLEGPGHGGAVSGAATVLGLTWKPGEVEVYDIEVEGLHNFFVRGAGSDAPGVLVHNSTGPKLLTNFGTGRFRGDQAIVHFEKHGSGVMRALGKDMYTLKDYVSDANHVIRTGTFVPEMNGFVRIVGGEGTAKAAFVGLDRASGHITTFGVRPVSEIARKAPSLGWSP